jgi:transcriptional regulator of met regulon
MINTYKTIIETEFSFVNPKKIYAKKGERVKIISISGTVAIVEISNGSKFPTKIKNLI